MSYLRFGLGNYGVGPYVRGITYDTQPEEALGDWAKQSDLTAESWNEGTDTTEEVWTIYRQDT